MCPSRLFRKTLQRYVKDVFYTIKRLYVRRFCAFKHLYWQSLSISAEMRLMAQGLGFLHPLPSLLLRRIFDKIVYFVTRRPFVAYPLTPVVMTIRVVWSYPYLLVKLRSTINELFIGVLQVHTFPTPVLSLTVMLTGCGHNRCLWNGLLQLFWMIRLYNGLGIEPLPCGTLHVDFVLGPNSELDTYVECWLTGPAQSGQP